MKYSVKEIHKALEYLKKHGDPVEISVISDPAGRGRLYIHAFTEQYGDISITLYESEVGKFAEVTKTERL